MNEAERERRSHILRVYRRLVDNYVRLIGGQFLAEHLSDDELFVMQSTTRMVVYGLLPQAGKMVRPFPRVALAWKEALTLAAKA